MGDVAGMTIGVSLGVLFYFIPIIFFNKEDKE